MKKNLSRVLGMVGFSTVSLCISITSVNAALYNPVECTSQPFFQSNTCDLCFEEKTLIPPGARIGGLYDTWINKTEEQRRVYQDEQTIKPTMLNLGGSGTKWVASLPNPDDMWEFTPQVVWTTTGTIERKLTSVTQGQSMKFIQQKSTEYYTLQASDKKNGEFIGMMKFPLAYRTVDPVTGAEGPKILHYECVTYKYDAPIVTKAPVTPPPKTEVVPAPKQITATKTGPETWVMGIVALITSAILVFRRLRRG